MHLVDTHCHLYAKEFDGDRHEVLHKAVEIGVSKFFLPCIDSSVIDNMLSLEKQYSDKCFAMMGLHPCSVNQNFAKELACVQEWLGKRKFIAVGEIGLDFYWDKTYMQEQLEAFNKQMQWALDYKLPVAIHTRNAMTETIEAVRPFATKGLKGVFHCFGDTKEVAEEIISMGFLLGIGGVLTYKNAGLSQVLKSIATEHLVLETDAPYLAPVPYRGKRNESSYLLTIADKLAEIKDISLDCLAEITTANAENLFGH